MLASSLSTVDVWFDGRGLLRQMTQPLNAVAGGSLTMTFTRYGVPVRVSAPPPDKTITFVRFTQLLLRKESERTL